MLRSKTSFRGRFRSEIAEVSENPRFSEEDIRSQVGKPIRSRRIVDLKILRTVSVFTVHCINKRVYFVPGLQDVVSGVMQRALIC